MQIQRRMLINMPQFAPVVPPQLLREMHRVSNNLVGRYHLLLAHDVAVRPREYREVIPPAAFVIMDNSMIELGHPVSWSVMKDALEAIYARLIVLPDVYGDAKVTVELSNEAAAKWPLGPNQGFMAVPQGNTIEEYTMCAQAMASMRGVSAFGIARTFTKDFETRQKALDILSKLRPTRAGHGPFIHLLGFSDNFIDDMRCSRHKDVIGIDSAVPVREGQNGHMLEFGNITHSPRGDFWEREATDITPETIANLFLVREWIQPLQGQWPIPNETLLSAVQPKTQPPADVLSDSDDTVDTSEL